MGTLPPEAEGVEEFVIHCLDDLTDTCNPPPQALGPASLFGVALGRMDYLSPVMIEPAAMVFGAFEAFVGYLSSREGRAHTFEPGVWIGPEIEEGLRQRLLGTRGGPETKARDHPGGIDRGEQRETLLPSQAIGPTDVGVAGEPSVPSALTVPDGHRRAVQSLVRALASCIPQEEARQVQGESLDELRAGAYQAIELRAVGQGRESIAQFGVGIAVEVPLARETALTSKDGQGYDLAPAEGCFGTGPSFWRLRVAELVCDNVECGEEGVHVEHEESVPFPSGSVSKPTLLCGHLPLKSSIHNSHQVFKWASRVWALPFLSALAHSERYAKESRASTTRS